MNYLNITYPDVNNGSGCRVTFWVAGCPHHCNGCHNPESWNPENGKSIERFEAVKLLKPILNLPYIDGLTLSGGEPFAPYNVNEVSDIVLSLMESGLGSKNIWAFTGYTFEEIYSNKDCYNLLQLIDVLVDGPFIESLKDLSLPFRGSSNQRIIDVQQSLKENKIILWQLHLV